MYLNRTGIRKRTHINLAKGVFRNTILKYMDSKHMKVLNVEQTHLKIVCWKI